MAKIDTSKITGYAEMSAEDKLKALEAFEYEDNVAELEKQKAAVSKANSEAAGPNGPGIVVEHSPQHSNLYAGISLLRSVRFKPRNGETSARFNPCS